MLIEILIGIGVFGYGCFVFGHVRGYGAGLDYALKQVDSVFGKKRNE